MRSIQPNIYEITNIEDTQPITSAEVASWIRLSPGMATLEADNITRLIETTTEVFESYLWLYLRRTTFQADFLFDCGLFNSFLIGDLKLSLERSPILALTDITKIEYLDTDGTYTEFDLGAMTVDGLYENATAKKEQRGWASVYFREPVPFDYTRINAYKIRVTFIAGYTTPGDPTPVPNPLTDVPKGLKTAMLMTVADYYTNRGDCGGCDCDMGGFPVPCAAKRIADRWSVARTVVGLSGVGDCCDGGW